MISLIPKSKKIWVFGAWFGDSFSDNPKYMYQYISSIDNEIKPIWIAKSKELVKELNSEKVNAFYYKSIKGLYYQSIAKVVFVGHSISSDLNPFFIGFSTKRVQLWHGIPLKKIGFDDLIYNSKNRFSLKAPKISALLTNDYYDVVTSTGEKCSKLFSTAFNMPIDKCVITGFPRNDVFHNHGKINSNYRVIYMPTFRASSNKKNDLFGTYGFNLKDIESKLKKENISLEIRVHPANKPSTELLTAIKDSEVISFSKVSDIYEEINNYDCLVTDYSSIMFDFALSGKTIIFAPFDLEGYLVNERGLYYSYEELTGNEYSMDWGDLINRIVKCQREPEKKVYNEFLDSFHDMPADNNSYAQAVYTETKSLFKNKGK